MESNNQPRDPSLALCQICANAGDVQIYAQKMDGTLTVVRTCPRIVCNDFVPLHPGTLEWKKREMISRAKYGRF